MRGPEQRCGFVALVGRPNVGKSTLFNRLVGAHLSAVTHKPQTTRYNIRGVLTQSHRQMIFVDTPGLHRRVRHSLSRVLNRNALRVLPDVDIAVMIAVCDRWLDEDETVLNAVSACGKPALLVLNKVDRVRDKTALLETIANLSRKHDFAEIFPLSALRDTDFDHFTREIGARLPKGGFIFDEDRLSDRSERFIAAELVREQLMLELHQELPYAAHVEIERFEKRTPVVHVSAVIFVEKANQRAIVIGRGGGRLKRVGRRARTGIEELLGKRVFLQLWVKTRSAWRNDPAVLSAYASDGDTA